MNTPIFTKLDKKIYKKKKLKKKKTLNKVFEGLGFGPPNPDLSFKPNQIENNGTVILDPKTSGKTRSF
jgi:hypothetical protein